MPDERTLPYARQSVDEVDIAAVVEVLRGDRLTTGPAVQAFERALADRVRAREAVVVNSGTAALHAAYAGIGLGPGDEIITSPLTFVATASAAMHLGARVRFADVDARTGTLDPALASTQVGDATRAIAPVDYAGHPADYTALRALASSRGVALVADAAHSLGATWAGCHVGTLADASTFSFHPVKAITTGEGGAVVTNDPGIAERARDFRSHCVVRDAERLRDGDGRGAWYYEVQQLGLNYRLPDVLCALGLSQLRKLDSFIARRRDIAARYDQALSSVEQIELPFVDPRADPAWHLYVVRVRDAGRKEPLFSRLQQKGLGVQVHYHPVHLHPAFGELGYRPGLCPVAEDFAARAISLPLFPAMSDDDVDYVIETTIACVRDVL